MPITSRGRERSRARGHGLAAAAAPFVATDIANAVLWMRPDAPQVVLNGSTVSQASDRSASAAHLTQSTAVAQPTYAASGGAGPSGKAALAFDGGDALRCPVALTGAKTIALVFRFTSLPAASSSTTPLSLKGAGNLFADVNLNALGGAYQPYSFLHDFSNATSVGFAGALDLSAHVLLITYNGGTNTSTASYTASLDGTAKTIVASGAIGRTTTDLGALGGRIDSAGAPTVSLFTGYVSEVAVYARVLTSGEQSTLVASLKSYYGVA